MWRRLRAGTNVRSEQTAGTVWGIIACPPFKGGRTVSIARGVRVLFGFYVKCYVK